jgi:hypothetical protein
MRNVTLKGLLAHKLRLALTALAIVLGVTFISGTFVLTDTLHNTFSVLFSSVYQNIDFQVRGVAAARQQRRERGPQRAARVAAGHRPPGARRRGRRRARSRATPSSWPGTASRSRRAARRPSA